MNEVERLQAENKMLRAEIKRKEMENAILKNCRKSKGGGLKRRTTGEALPGRKGAA